jgi:bacterioferritin (cytochrome b1)
MIPFADVLIGSVVSAVVSYCTASLHMSNKIGAKHSELELKIAQNEAVIAREYVSRQELDAISRRIEEHMVRIETKLDNLAYKPSNNEKSG